MFVGMTIHEAECKVDDIMRNLHEVPATSTR
jgi:hypothetical protein